MRYALSKVDLAMFFMAPTWPPKEAYADDTSDVSYGVIRDRGGRAAGLAMSAIPGT